MHGEILTPATFQRLTRVLLDPEASPGAWFDSANRLHPLLTEAGDLAETHVPGAATQETTLAGGKALSPVDAGRCLLDLARTRAFLQGLAAAISDRRALRPGRPVHVLYAGCGPFATLALPLTAVYGPEIVQFTLMDVHAASVESVRRIVKALDLHAYVAGLHLADATAYEVPADTSFDILLVETMQRALTREPQVTITRHLVPQLDADVLLLPTSIRVRACLADIAAEVSPGVQRRDRVELGTVFELNAKTARADDLRDGYLPAGVVCAPRALHAGESFILATTVQVYGGAGLDDYASGVTFPEIVTLAGPLEAGTEVAFTYRLDPPGLCVRSVAEGS